MINIDADSTKRQALIARDVVSMPLAYSAPWRLPRWLWPVLPLNCEPDQLPPHADLTSLWCRTVGDDW